MGTCCTVLLQENSRLWLKELVPTLLPGPLLPWRLSFGTKSIIPQWTWYPQRDRDKTRRNGYGQYQHRYRDTLMPVDSLSL